MFYTIPQLNSGVSSIGKKKDISGFLLLLLSNLPFVQVSFARIEESLGGLWEEGWNCGSEAGLALDGAR